MIVLSVFLILSINRTKVIFFLVFWYFPFSNAAVERVFSQMNIVKTNLRNKMGLKSLNAILSIRLDFKMFNNLIYTKDILLNFINMDYDVMANVAMIMKFQANTSL